jgi:hypothetical protein
VWSRLGSHLGRVLVGKAIATDDDPTDLPICRQLVDLTDSGPVELRP